MHSFKLPQPQNVGIKFVPSDLQIITSRQMSTPASPLSVYNVAIPSASLLAATTSGISAQDGIKPLITSQHFHTMEVPACIVDHIAPHLVQRSSTGHIMVPVLIPCSTHVCVLNLSRWHQCFSRKKGRLSNLSRSWLLVIRSQRT